MFRYWIGSTIPRYTGTDFPWATLAINIGGSFLIGLLAARLGPQSAARALLMTGFCGGFTTFSTFSLETLNLIHGGQWSRAILYMLLSVAACVIGAWAGYSTGPETTRG